MILVDTSVLVGYFRGSQDSFSNKMNYLIDNEIPFGICNYIYQELLQGAANEKEYKLLREYLSTLPFYNLLNGKQSFENAARIYMGCRKTGITIRSTIDLIIVEIAIENDLYLFHNDIDFKNMSRVYRNLKIY